MLVLLTLAISIFLAQTVVSLRVTQGSPCQHRCGPDTSNTTGDDIVCRDFQFSDTPVGTQFQSCIECELDSTHFVSGTSESDVEWALYNLRYAFSTCIFGFPVVKQSLSTPCQVSCEELRSAAGYELRQPSGFTTYDFCGLSSFSDGDITRCAECYALTEDEKYMANFIETIRQGCHSEVPLGSPFIFDPTRIFDRDLIPASTASVAPDGRGSDGDGKPDNLVIIIVLPIIGFLILLTCLAIGCFFLVRHRRRKARRHSQAEHLHERWNDTSIITPMPGGLTKLWNGEQMPHTPHRTYDPSTYQPEYFGGVQPGDVKHPSGAYMMETSPSSPVTGQQQGQQYQYMQQASVPTKTAADVPILSDPPPRKSLSKPAE